MRRSLALLALSIVARAGEDEARALVPRIEEPEAFARLVEMKAIGPLVEATAPGQPERVRRLACLALGRIGGDDARDRLLEILSAPTPEPKAQGALRLYAAAGLTILEDPGTAVDLVLQLSTVNPNDNVMALAAEAGPRDYFTVDAQICEALLAMGLWTAEDELVAQLRRRDQVRVLIDAYAVLRRYTGIDLPYRYNGGLGDREADAAAWEERLRETRGERMRAHPFDSANARFRARCGDMIAWLGGMKVNERYIAEKVFVRLGPVAVPILADALRTGTPVTQREVALVLGWIGDPAAAPALRDALGSPDAKARARSLEALLLLRDREAVALAVLRLADADPEVRGNAAKLVGELGDASRLPDLRQALEREKAPGTTTHVVCALSRLGEDQRQRLLATFIDGDQLSREAAHAELHRLAPEWKADPLLPREERAAAAGRFPLK